MLSILQPNGAARPPPKTSVFFGFTDFIFTLLSDWNILNLYFPLLKKLPILSLSLKATFHEASLVIKLDKTL